MFSMIDSTSPVHLIIGRWQGHTVKHMLQSATWIALEKLQSAFVFNLLYTLAESIFAGDFEQSTMNSTKSENEWMEYVSHLC